MENALWSKNWRSHPIHPRVIGTGFKKDSTVGIQIPDYGNDLNWTPVPNSLEYRTFKNTFLEGTWNLTYGPLEYRSGFQIAILKPDCLATRHVWTIQIPD